MTMGEGTLAAVVNWNGREDTLRCLSALGAADGIARIVVVDNGSTDGSVEAIRRRFDAVVILQAPRNIGFAAAANMAARFFQDETSCRYLFLVNNDMVIAPDAVRRLAAEAEASPAIGACTPKIFYQDPPDKLWYAGGRIDWKRGTCVHFGMGETDRGRYDRARDVSFACGALVLVTRAAVAATGLFDARYFMYEEDVELSLRIAEAGHTLRYVPEAVAWHKVGASSLRRGEPFIWYYLIRNRLYTVRDHAGAGDKIKFRAYFPLLFGWKSLRFICTGRPSVAAAMARGIVDYVKGKQGETYTAGGTAP